MKIAITGGNGRIGRAVIKLALGEGHCVVSIDCLRSKNPITDIIDRFRRQDSIADIKHAQIDTSDYDALVDAFRGCDALIHLAAIPSPNDHSDHFVHNNNTVSSYNALRAAADIGIERVCQASSINAIGGAYSRSPHYEYFPLDEKHPSYNEDPYSLSKYICELQADSMARRFDMTIASLRIHSVVQRREDATQWGDLPNSQIEKQLWGYVRIDATARACLLGVSAKFSGHEVFYITAPDTMIKNISSLELAAKYFPDVPITGNLSGNRGFFSCKKAEELLGWRHDDKGV